MRRHVLKCDPSPFTQHLEGVKTFEIRKDDRDFKVGDILELHETKYPAKAAGSGKNPFTGLSVERRVLSVLTGSDYGLKSGYCIMSVAPLTAQENTFPLDVQVGGDHYKQYGKYQPMEVLKAWLSEEEFKGAMKKDVIYYLTRDKTGREDIEKACHTIQLYLHLTQEEPKNGCSNDPDL